ncbi:MAG: hypothetical protein HOP15_16680 [Planctomycetes bacterium]|nr:hypothetical protein [Planctomycetota bacterium]
MAGLAGACGGSAGSSGQSGITGKEETKPGGGFFFVDVNGSGGSSNVRLAEVRWGRLVDVHEVDGSGKRIEDHVFRDMVIEPFVVTDNTSYVLDRNSVTQRERLTILARKTGVLDTSGFDQLLAAARDALPLVTEKGFSAPPPFSAVPRNACLVLRFDDCLDDRATSALNLPNTVKVFSGYPPSTFFASRVVFDPNHGALVGGLFHTTRVLVDLTASEDETDTLTYPLDVNPVGFPASVSSSQSTNLGVRIPTRVDVGSGQSRVLTNLSGQPLDTSSNGPVDLLSPTRDVLRAARSGQDGDASNGFLPDSIRPRVVGGWPITVTSAANDPGDPGFDFVLALSFTTTCLNDPAVGDVIRINGAHLEVTQAAALVGSDVAGLRVRSAVVVSNSLTLQGQGLFEAPFHPSLALGNGCWVSFLPNASAFPATGVLTSAQVQLRFSEPMDPGTLSPFRNFLVVKGSAQALSSAISHNVIVGEVTPSSDLTLFSFVPKLPLPHVSGNNETLHVELGDPSDPLISPRDLAGNALRHDLPFVDFTIDPPELDQNNGAIVLRFEDDNLDEYGANGGGPDTFADLRGQFFPNGEKGSIFPRAVSFAGWPADRTNPVPRNMVPVPGGVTYPLNPLGAKLQTLWRYCDLGWNARDETKYDLDVVGLSWSPAAGGVQADFYELFEIRLGHSRWLPDEAFQTSGLPFGTTFEGNFLADSNPKVVHSRTLGYALNPSNRFTATTGVVMMPYPLNLGSFPDVTYTWRDTAILTLGADGGAGTLTPAPGIPLDIEDVVNVIPNGTAGSIAARTLVPSFGLPLLIEFSCFPSDSGLGINALDVSLGQLPAVPPALPPPPPNFRIFSAGGITSIGTEAPILPDSELIPKGGFNATTGLTTPPGDNVFYLGQLDTVVRLSRVHTVWLDSGLGDTSWKSPVMEPAAGQPSGTLILLDFRSASNFSGGGTAPFNGAALNAYGNQTTNAPLPPPIGWSSNIALANPKRFLQTRITFVNNPATGLSPELTALAFPYTK